MIIKREAYTVINKSFEYWICNMISGSSVNCIQLSTWFMVIANSDCASGADMNWNLIDMAIKSYSLSRLSWPSRIMEEWTIFSIKFFIVDVEFKLSGRNTPLRNCRFNIVESKSFNTESHVVMNINDNKNELNY